MGDVIDVSGSQTKPWPDYAAARRAGVLAVYVKATEGQTYRSPHFRRHVELATGAGLEVGLYHFALPDRGRGDAASEYRNARAALAELEDAGLRVHLRLSLDVERGRASSSRPATVTDRELAAWCSAWVTHHTTDLGYYPVLYASRSYLRGIARGASSAQLAHLRQCPLWVAGDDPATPTPWPEAALWQTPLREVDWYSKAIDVDETTTAEGIRPLLRPEARRGGG